MSRLALHLDAALVHLHATLNHRQSQPSAAIRFLGGEIGLEDARARLGRYAATIVLDPDLNTLFRATARQITKTIDCITPALGHPGSNGQSNPPLKFSLFLFGAILNCMPGIGNQVQDALLDLAGVALDGHGNIGDLH